MTGKSALRLIRAGGKESFPATQLSGFCINCGLKKPAKYLLSGYGFLFAL
jgi:hypothetical protein